MKTKKKIGIFATIAAAMALVAGITLFNFSASTVYADETFAPTEEYTTAFRMLDGSSIKLDEDGFAFRAIIDKATYDSLGENQSVYFMIIPKVFEEALAEQDYKYYRAIKRYTDIDDENYGEFDKAASKGALYVKAGRIIAGGIDVYDNGAPIDCYFVQAGVKGLVTKGYHEEDYFAVACIETRTYDEVTGKVKKFTYTYAEGVDGEEYNYPVNNLYNSVNSVALYAPTDYSEVIKDAPYSWYGTEDYPVKVDSLSDYNAFVAKINGEADFSDMLIDLDKNIETGEAAATPATSLYTVTFNNASGSPIKTYTVLSGSTVSALSESPSKTADHHTYTFKEWQTGGKAFDFTATITENTVLTPAYNAAINYTLSLNAASADLYYDTTEGTGSFGFNATHKIDPSIDKVYDGVSYTYSSSDTSVATVEDGLVTSASTKGTATITVTLTDALTGDTLTDSVTVTNTRYYEISNKTGFDTIKNTDSTGYYRMTDDISLGTISTSGSVSDDTLTGGYISSFGGTLDGCGHRLIYSYNDSHYKFLINKIESGAVVKNLRIDLDDTANTNARAGHFALAYQNYGTITDCFANSTFNQPGQAVNGLGTYVKSGLVGGNFGKIYNNVVLINYTGDIPLNTEFTSGNQKVTRYIYGLAASNANGAIMTANMVVALSPNIEEDDQNVRLYENTYGREVNNIIKYSLDDALTMDTIYNFGNYDYDGDGKKDAEYSFDIGTLWAADPTDWDVTFNGENAIYKTATISFEDAEMLVEKNGSLTVAAIKTQTNRAIEYTSSNSNIAVDSSTGAITTATAGETTITATVKGVSATTTVIVYTATLGSSTNYSTFTSTINADLNGYYILAGNVTLGNINAADHKTQVITSDFGGTLNGMGYKLTYSASWVSGASNHDKSLFATLTSTAVVKNIHISATYDTTNGVRRAAVANTNNGLIENCFIEATYANVGQSTNATYSCAGVVMTNGGTINNNIVKIKYTSTNAIDDKLYAVCALNDTGAYITNTPIYVTATNVSPDDIKYQWANKGTKKDTMKLKATSSDTYGTYTLDRHVKTGEDGYRFNLGTLWSYDDTGVYFNGTKVIG